jgi:hypothetical protein
MNDNNREGNAVDVHDKPTEVGIKLNNVLTAMTVAILLWIGTSLISVKDEIAAMRTELAVGEVEVEYLQRQLDEHINDRSIHIVSDGYESKR